MIGNYDANQDFSEGGMMPGGLRPYTLTPLNRGCVETISVEFKNSDRSWVDKTDKKLYFTAKTKPWDDDTTDSDAVFKVVGVIPDPSAPGHVEFNLTEQQTYLDPKQLYFCDIVQTDADGTSNATRIFIGNFNVIGGANNAQTGGR